MSGLLCTMAATSGARLGERGASPPDAIMSLASRAADTKPPATYEEGLSCTLAGVARRQGLRRPLAHLQVDLTLFPGAFSPTYGLARPGNGFGSDGCRSRRHKS